MVLFRHFSLDDTIYDVVFQTTAQQNLILRVKVPLTSSFAYACPEMTLAGVKARHPWLDSFDKRITGYEPLQSESSWKMSGLLLGKAVTAVVQHMQLNPPQILEITDKGLAAIQPNGGAASSGRPSSSNSRTPPRNRSTLIMP